MKSINPILFLVLLAELGSKVASSASPTASSDFPRMGHTSETFPRASENSTSEFPGVASPKPSKAPLGVSLEPSPHVFTETSKSNVLNASISEPLETPKITPSPKTHLETSETPKPYPTEIPHPESSETPKPNSSATSHPEFPGPLNPGPTQTPCQESPGIPKLNSTESSHSEAPDPDLTLHSKTPENHDLNTTETPNSEFFQTLHSVPTDTPHPESHVTHNPGPTEIPQSKSPTTHYQDATEIPTDSNPEISTRLHLETPAPFKDQATALNELLLNTDPETLAATQTNSLKLPISGFPGTIEPKASQNSSPKGPDGPPSSSRIANPPAPPGPPGQVAPATLRTPQRRGRDERVNTIILVERVKETGLTLVGRPQGLAGGALCFFFLGTGLLISIFLLLWCLYRRGARHRPFAHHRLPNDGDELVMHLDTPKKPSDLYFYAPDAWVPSHITTKQPPPTPPLPPKLPPPPRGGRPQRLEPLCPATLPTNFE